MNRNISSLVVAVCGLAILVPERAAADGKIFSRAIAVRTTTPDQRALIHFVNGTETLVIETSFVGQGTNFAWVVPVPSVPRVEAATPGLFRNLDMVFQPKVVDKVPAYWALVEWIGFNVWCFRRETFRGWDGCFGFAVWLFLQLFLVGMILPAGVKARGYGPTLSAAVTVLDRKLVGIYDTVTLSGKGGASVVAWLNENGFTVSPATTPVFNAYAKDGWVFVAARVNRPGEAEAKSSPHPLALTFRTEKAIYPLRLTGIENGSCSIELYVFGQQRAESPRFKVEYCGETKFPALEPQGRRAGWCSHLPSLASFGFAIRSWCNSSKVRLSPPSSSAGLHRRT